MEKTIQIVIASTSFLCTEDAYERLFSYLKSMEAHFGSEAEREEIMRDIESRIAEKLLERNQVVMRLSEVEAVIKEMGEVSELEDSTESASLEQEKHLEKRLYRDMDTALIAGVASGIAAYFNANPLLIRIIFVASIFFGGTGIILYFILWVLIPEAKTSIQKLEMRGEPITFGSISSLVREQAQDTNEHGVVRRIPFMIRAVVTRIFRFLGTVTGLLLTLGSFIGVIVLTIGLGVIFTNWNAPYNDIPFREASSTFLLLTAVCAGYLALVIPLIFMFLLGYRLTSRKNLLPSIVGFGLLGMWSLALITSGVSGFKIAGDYYNYIETNPEYAEITRTVPLEAFSRVVTDGVRIQIVQDETQEAIVEGRASALDRVLFSMEDGTLTIQEAEKEESCLFCDEDSPTIILHTPTLKSVEVQSGSVAFERYASSTLGIFVDRGTVYGSLAVENLTLDVRDGTVRSDILSRTLTVKGIGSSFYLSGSTTNASLALMEHSYMHAKPLIVQDADVEAISSYAELTVRGRLTENVDRESEIIVTGRENTGEAEAPTQIENRELD